MNYTIYAAFAVPALSALTYLAYKHPSGYRNLSNLIFGIIAVNLLVLLSFLLGSEYSNYIGWVAIVAGTIGWLVALRFLPLFIDNPGDEDRPRNHNSDDSSKSGDA